MTQSQTGIWTCIFNYIIKPTSRRSTTETAQFTNLKFARDIFVDLS
jgi:hypothetical protein